MKKIVFAMAVAMFATTAQAAITIPSGSVLTTNPDGTQSVAPAASTVNTQRQIDINGYAVAGGQVHVRVGGETVSVDRNELTGQTHERILEIIGEAAVEQLTGVDASGIDLGDIQNVSEEDLNDLAQSLADAGVSLEEIQAVTDEIQFQDFGNQFGDAVEQALRDLDAGLITGATVIDEHGNTHLIGDHAN